MLFVVPRKATLHIELKFFDNVSYQRGAPHRTPSGTLFVPFSLQKSKALIFIHAARVGNNRHRVFVLLCTRCLKPCLHGVRLQPLAQPSSKRKEAQGENALCLHTEVSASDKCRERLERRVRYDKKHILGVYRTHTNEKYTFTRPLPHLFRLTRWIRTR